MKTTKLFTLALGALLLAGCSSDAIDDPGNGSGTNTEGTGYLKVSVNLPTRAASSGSRANDNFDDGGENEYAVYNATLLLFGGDDEASATFQGAYDLAWNGNNDADNDQITTQMTKVVKIESLTDTKKYALVVLNRGNILTLNGNGAEIKGTALTKGTTTLKDITNMPVESESDFTSSGFFMTNAVLTTTPGTDEGRPASGGTTATATILAPINGCIYNTEAEANAPDAKAADVIVERAVAKVSVAKSTATSGDLKVYNEFEIGRSDDTKYTLTWEVKCFELANKNTSSYLIRNWGSILQNEKSKVVGTNGDAWLNLKSDATTVTDNAYRFAGKDAIQITTKTSKGTDPKDPDGKDYYRTYWGIDPNYGEPLGTVTNPTTMDASDLNAKYCLENTFDVNHQTVENTTCAIVKVHCTLSTNGNSTDNALKSRADESTTTSTLAGFYTINRNSDNLYNEKGMRDLVATTVEVDAGSTLMAALKEKVKPTEGTSANWEYVINYSKAQVTFDDTEKLKITGIDGITATVKKTDGSESTYTIDITKDNATYKESSSEETATALSTDVTLSTVQKAFKERYFPQYYKITDNGFDCYYVVRIKHFGDDLTPWSIEGKSVAYPEDDTNRDGNYLGRYGVLRNNWYDIQITGIDKLGMVDVPNPGTGSDNYDVDKTDDELDTYIRFRINVLSWAKRVQGTVLKN